MATKFSFGRWTMQLMATAKGPKYFFASTYGDFKDRQRSSEDSGVSG